MKNTKMAAAGAAHSLKKKAAAGAAALSTMQDLMKKAKMDRGARPEHHFEDIGLELLKPDEKVLTF